MSWRDRAPYFAYRAGAAVAQALPQPVAKGLARALGVGFSRAMEGRRTMIRRHLRRVYGPHVSEAELDQKVRMAFDSYARYWLESFRLARVDAERLDAGMTWEGIDRIEDARRLGKGVICALPHLGGWDFGGAWFCATGYEATVVVESLEPPELFEWFRSMREGFGLTVVPHGPESGPAVLRALRANHLVGLVCDRDLTRTGPKVTFFGEETTLPGGPATLALRTGAPILPVAIYFSPRGHHGVVRPPLEVARTGRLRDDVARITQALAHELEALIRNAPEQWHLLQPNWPSDYDLVASSAMRENSVITSVGSDDPSSR